MLQRQRLSLSLFDSLFRLQLLSLNETGGNVVRNLVWVSEPVANRLNAWMSEGECLTSWREKDYANIYSTCCTKFTCLLENPSFTLREAFMFNHLKRKEIACYQVVCRLAEDIHGGSEEVGCLIRNSYSIHEFVTILEHIRGCISLMLFCNTAVSAVLWICSVLWRICSVVLLGLRPLLCCCMVYDVLVSAVLQHCCIGCSVDLFCSLEDMGAVPAVWLV
ncbi:hypothetical protein LOK49_LG02G02223 [Camellia lanceoleosa]|uniref:Uncharacterized protein n=1 Tax=Camellia lanceoleosa TaxID=1840588 RepID=A0ACC0IP86_9ERIC|nr:hypothetical protein LOK49_LG02G02223 [Camellia lanceoleosa]